MRHTLVTLLALTITLAACAPVATASPTATAAPTTTSAPTATNAPTPTPTLSPADIAQGLDLDLSLSYRVIINDYDVTCLENTADGSCVAVYDEKDKAWYKVQHWDDPELLAGLKSDFEAKMGMSVEDYQNKAIEEKRASNGGTETYFNDKVKYVEADLNGTGLGTGIVKTESGVKHLVLYVAWGKGDNVKIRPLDVGFEGKEGFVQTSMDLTGVTTSRNLYDYENPLTFSSLDQMQQYLDENAIGVRVSFNVLIRFKDTASCLMPQGQHVGNVSDKYWQYIGNLCRTPGNYINIESQEPVINDGYGDRAQDYGIDNMIEKGVPEGGLIPTMVGIKILP